jgi:Uma2 family endonuclease
MSATVAREPKPVLLFGVSWDTYDRIVKALGDHRFRHTYQEGTLEVLWPVLYGIDWRTYERIVQAFGDRRFHHTYQEGALEFLMSPSLEHERIKGFLGRLVETMALECNIWIVLAGSTTQWSKPTMQGLEPDESYYIRPKRPSAKGFPDATLRPDLAIEVDLRRTELKRARSYAKLGVNELWRYRQGIVEILQRKGDATLKSIEKSQVLPYLTATDLTRFVKRMQDTDANEATVEFISWLRKQIKKSARSSQKKKET